MAEEAEASSSAVDVGDPLAARVGLLEDQLTAANLTIERLTKQIGSSTVQAPISSSAGPEGAAAPVQGMSRSDRCFGPPRAIIRGAATAPDTGRERGPWGLTPGTGCGVP